MYIAQNAEGSGLDARERKLARDRAAFKRYYADPDKRARKQASRRAWNKTANGVAARKRKEANPEWRARKRARDLLRAAKPDVLAQRAAQHALRRATRLAAGQCLYSRCTNAAFIGTHCTVCRLKKAAKEHLGSTKSWPLLYGLLRDYEFRCAYTGRALEPGVNLSFDHVKPRSKGGADSIDNLVPADLYVNQAKNNLSVRDFRALCAEVLASA